jgi:thiosulfate/3-mercaptopyruvate sulfurtransferase
VLEGEATPARPGDFTARPGSMPILSADGALALARRGRLLDARSEERFRGESEPVDPVAGHIPGAANRPTLRNLDVHGRFLPSDALRQAFGELGVTDRTEVGAYCGSGVTAAHQVLALELAGFSAALYPGSWSEWVQGSARPVATGPAVAF